MNLTTLLVSIALAVLISVPTFAIVSPIFVKKNTYSGLPALALKILLVFLLASSTLVYAYKGDLCEVEHWLEFLRLNPGIYAASYSFLLSLLRQTFSQNLFLLLCICGVFLILSLSRFLRQCAAVQDSSLQYSFASFLVLLFLNRYTLQFFSVPRTSLALALASISLVLFLSAKTKSFLFSNILSSSVQFLLSCFFAFLAISLHPTSALLIFPALLCLLRDIISFPLKHLYCLGIVVSLLFVFLGERLIGSFNDEVVLNWSLSSSIWVPVNLSVALLFCYCARSLYYLTKKYNSLAKSIHIQYLTIFGIIYTPFSITSSLINFERVNLVWPAYICVCLFILKRYAFVSVPIAFLYIVSSLIGSTILSFEGSGKFLGYDSFQDASIQLDCSIPIFYKSFFYIGQYSEFVLDASRNLIPLLK